MLTVLPLLQLLNIIGNELNYLLLLILGTNANNFLYYIISVTVIAKLNENLRICNKITNQLSFSLLTPFSQTFFKDMTTRLHFSQF